MPERGWVQTIWQSVVGTATKMPTLCGFRGLLKHPMCEQNQTLSALPSFQVHTSSTITKDSYLPFPTPCPLRSCMCVQPTLTWSSAPWAFCSCAHPQQHNFVTPTKTSISPNQLPANPSNQFLQPDFTAREREQTHVKSSHWGTVHKCFPFFQWLHVSDSAHAILKLFCFVMGLKSFKRSHCQKTFSQQFHRV